MPQLILYACPVGALADQIETYLAQSLARYGPNRAHAYMPHCTLTGFFHDQTEAISAYVTAAAKAVAQYPTGSVIVGPLRLKPEWHGLPLVSPWLEQVAAAFVRWAKTPTRSEVIRLKTGLHLSLAYGFADSQHAPLKQLAESLIDPTTPTDWQVRFYERHPSQGWVCHFSA